MRMKHLGIPVLALAVMMVSVSADEHNTVGNPSEDIAKLIDGGKAAYLAGDPQKALVSLRRAIAEIEGVIHADLAGFVPDAPTGWVTGEVGITSVGGSAAKERELYAVASRTYTREADGVEATLHLSNSPQMADAFRLMSTRFEDPDTLAVMQSTPEMKVKRLEAGGGWVGWVSVKKKGSVHLEAGVGKVVVRIVVNGDDEAVATALWNAIKHKELAKRYR